MLNLPKSLVEASLPKDAGPQPILPGVFAPNMEPVASDADIRKIFVKNIPVDVQDSLLEQILKECGELTSWKRNSNAKNIPLPFAYGEFDQVEDVLKCLRLVDGISLMGSKLQVKISDRAQEHIKKWKEEKTAELKANGISEDLETYLQREDERPKRKIAELLKYLDREDTRLARQRELERNSKDLPREKERQSKKKQMKAEMERKFNEKLSDWTRREENKARERAREKERLKEKEKEKKKYIEKEMAYDSDEERKNPRYLKLALERKRARDKERDDDEMEKRKEYLAAHPPSSTVMELERNDSEERNHGEVKRIKTTNEPTQRTSSKLVFQDVKMDEEKKAEGTPVENNFTVGLSLNNSTRNTAKSIFGKVKEEGNVENEEASKDESKKGELTKEILTKMMQSLPKTVEELKEQSIDWDLFFDNRLMSTKVIPWAKKKTVELMGTEEEYFLNIVIKLIMEREKPEVMVFHIKAFLEEDAPDFVLKLWRVMMFEVLKIEKMQELKI